MRITTGYVISEAGIILDCMKGEVVMDRGNTKQEILEAALELFSVQGFEATSISQIAGAVGNLIYARLKR